MNTKVTLYSFIFLTLTICFPNFANAQQLPDLNRAKIPVGTTALYLRETGNYYRITFLERTKQGFKDVVRNGRTGDGKVLAKRLLDAKGELLVTIQGDVKRTYKPHDCSRTLGRCNYRYSSVAGAARVKRTTKAKGDGTFSWVEKSFSNKEYRGVVSYEPRFGLLEQRVWTDWEGKKRSTKLQRIRLP